MSIKALLAAKAKLSADVALNAFWMARYSKPAKHIIGYKKPVNANDYPAICYVPVKSTRPDSVGGLAQERVSIIICIFERDITNDVFDGIPQLAIIEQLVLESLEAGQLGTNAMYLGEAQITGDLSTSHPFHELEISVLLAAR